MRSPCAHAPRLVLAALVAGLTLAGSSTADAQVATPASPLCGSEIASPSALLVASNAPAPPAPYVYDFQLYRDVGLTILVADANGVPQGAGATTSWPVPVFLGENQRYFWRVRARDGTTAGPWSAPACAFFVNTVNEPPNMPTLNSPAFGAQVNSFTPTLRVNNVDDPDFDNLRYQYEVYADPALSIRVAFNMNPVAEGGMGTTSWVVNVNLLEDRYYYWRARALDPDSLAGPWSASGQFFVTTTNAPPEPAAIVSPQNGTVAGGLRPALVILNADDSDLDPLVYDWDLALDVSFANIVQSGANDPPSGTQTTSFHPNADLAEDTRYCWRVRSDDGQAQSGYNVACFLVSSRNDPPSVPTPGLPSSEMDDVSTTPFYSWAPSTDPEDGPITYDIVVEDAAGEEVASVVGVNGTVTATATELIPGATYAWRVRATDREGASSAFSEEQLFTVRAEPVTCCESDGGCQAGGSTPGTGAGLGLAVFVLGLRRRRPSPQRS